jgi:hypothetical protein
MIADIKKSAEQKMIKTLDTLKADLGKVRTGRAHTGLLDHVMVDYYGTPTPINGVANVTLLDARTIGVTPWDKKMVAVVDKAIRESDLGLNPATMGETVRVPMPALTEERRRDLIKVVHKEAENARRGPQYPARSQQSAQGSAQAKKTRRRRGTPRSGRGTETDGPLCGRNRQSACRQRSRPDRGIVLACRTTVPPLRFPRRGRYRVISQS